MKVHENFPPEMKSWLRPCPQCSNVFIQVRNICFTGNLRMGGESIFKVGGTIARQNNYKIFVFELATVSSQALKYDVINFCQHV